MKVNKNVWVGKNKPYNKNSLHFPNGIDSGSGGDAPSGGGESGSNIEYIDLKGDLVLGDILTGGIVEMKATIENTDFPIEGAIGVGTAVFPLLAQLKNTGATVNLIAISYNRDAVIVTKQDGVVVTQTAYEQLASQGESYVELYNSAPRLTKEEFYNLN